MGKITCLTSSFMNRFMHRQFMRQLLITLSYFFAVSSAYAASVCSETIFDLKYEKPMLAKLNTFTPLRVERFPSSQCIPKTNAIMAMGAPLCLFDGEIPVAATIIETLETDGSITGYVYMIPFSPMSHAKLLASLKNRYTEVPEAMHPEPLKSKVAHREIAAIFKINDVYISLAKPTDGPDGEQNSEKFSTVSFIKEKYFELAHRDGTCK